MPGRRPTTKFHSHASEPLKAPQQEASYSPEGSKGKNFHHREENLINEKNKIEEQLKRVTEENKSQKAANEKLMKEKADMGEVNEKVSSELQSEQTKRCEIEKELLGQKEINRHMESKVAALEKKLSDTDSMPVTKIACERCYKRATEIQSKVVSRIQSTKMGSQCIECYSTYGNKEGILTIIDKTPVVRSVAAIPEVISTTHKFSDVYYSSSSLFYKLFTAISCITYLCFILSLKAAYLFSPVRWIRSARSSQ
eukprot:TRINITY_DN409_c2_g1_i2.p1 TRINITY_DN409_c2_g1~~TRINITY_DN409_c2_g1_i2.p1  ORF type:complete len:254 (+),score=54.77 TRINITY_DN409_c2_g1_i2:67-828(+)